MIRGHLELMGDDPRDRAETGSSNSACGVGPVDGLRPALVTTYRRSTLTDPTAHERLTCDIGQQVLRGRRPPEPRPPIQPLAPNRRPLGCGWEVRVPGGVMEGVTDMPAGSNRKRERQYEHIKEGLEDRGRSEDVAEEIAARTVNKERARSGEAKESSRSSTHDISSGRRGGLRSHSGSKGRTKEQLYNEAKQKNIKGRSTMTKAQLAKAVGR